MKNIDTPASKFKESIFATISRKSIEAEAINLGQGFPDFRGPAWLSEIASDTFLSPTDYQQYAPYMGLPILREKLSERYEQYFSLNYLATDEILITNGATGALFYAALGLISPGDEAIVFEPFYDSYVANIEMAHGKVVPCRLEAPEFRLNTSQLEKVITEKTKVIFLNNPHNPSGRVFSQDELTGLAKIVSDHDLYVISDEVYEYLTYEQKHIPFASLPGMKERTITISSMGKTLGSTGWKIGWAMAPAPLLKNLVNVHQYNVFSVNTPLQKAVATALENYDSYIPEFQKQYLELRNYFCEGLEELGFEVIPPEGTYFVLSKIPAGLTMNDQKAALEMIERAGVSAIPPSVFYLENPESRYLRFCFAKTRASLSEALSRLEKIR